MFYTARARPGAAAARTVRAAEFPRPNRLPGAPRVYPTPPGGPALAPRPPLPRL